MRSAKRFNAFARTDQCAVAQAGHAACAFATATSICFADAACTASVMIDRPSPGSTRGSGLSSPTMIWYYKSAEMLSRDHKNMCFLMAVTHFAIQE